ncbi:hypothetical protein BC629DRAFT_1518200 [Irpex lacteus]|nr:hypothetical protein BC629DRAFT_1518200 [Irpex lacteus]
MADRQNLVRHQHLWFEDGNVVLVAETTGFRVYRGLLARHSEIFHDMFSCHNQNRRPRIRTKAVQSSAWRMILLMRWLRSSLCCMTVVKGAFYGHDHRMDVPTLEAALRLGTKFAFNDIRHEALRRFSIFTLTRWRSSKDMGAEPLCAAILANHLEDKIVFALLHSYQYGLDASIPAALYNNS